MINDRRYRKQLLYGQDVKATIDEIMESGDFDSATALINQAIRNMGRAYGVKGGVIA
jgi:Arc/MetJ-type ribon-helix-helix transcriptional regulator